MAIKLIALDMDGTTLDNNHFTISAKNRKAITNAITNGIIVVPVTGRTLFELPNSIKKTGIRFAITSNGAFTADLQNNEKMFANLIPSKTALCVLKIIEEYNVYAEVYYRGKAYTERGATSKILNRGLAFKLLYSFFARRVKVDSLTKFISKNGNPLEKIELLPVNRLKKEELEQKLREIPLSITTSGMNSIEITNQGTTKGKALANLCRYLQVEADAVMAIGDSLNDLEMLNWAGLAVAVANADPIVKSIADFVTLENNHNGVAYAIERFIK